MFCNEPLPEETKYYIEWSLQVSGDRSEPKLRRRSRSKISSTKGDIDVINYVMIFHYIFITRIITWKKSNMKTSDDRATVSLSTKGYELKVLQRRSTVETLILDLHLLFQPSRRKSIGFGGAKILKSKL